MIIYGKIQHGQRVMVVQGPGFSFNIYDKAGAIKNETPQASGAGKTTSANCYDQHNAVNAPVKRKIDVRA